MQPLVHCSDKENVFHCSYGSVIKLIYLTHFIETEKIITTNYNNDTGDL